MIDREEIDATSKLLGVNTSDVQRDYLYGWLLTGLYGDNSLFRDRLVLKGGNAFRKAYFVNTRFSGDLDFAAPAGLYPGRLLDALNHACQLAQARTGVELTWTGTPKPASAASTAARPCTSSRCTSRTSTANPAE